MEQYPIMADAGFIQTIEDVIATQVPLEHKAALGNHFPRLRQIAEEKV